MLNRRDFTNVLVAGGASYTLPKMDVTNNSFTILPDINKAIKEVGDTNGYKAKYILAKLVESNILDYIKKQNTNLHVDYRGPYILDVENDTMIVSANCNRTAFINVRLNIIDHFFQSLSNEISKRIQAEQIQKITPPCVAVHSPEKPSNDFIYYSLWCQVA